MHLVMIDMARLAALDPAVLAHSARDCERAMIERHAAYASLAPSFPPILTPRHEEVAFGQLVEELFTLFASLPTRLSAKSGFDALLAQLRYTPAQQAMLLPYVGDPWSRLAASLTRFDVIATTQGLKVIELNATGGVGGLGVLDDYIETFETSVLAGALRARGIDFRMMRPIDSWRAFIAWLAHDHGVYRQGAAEPLRVAIATLPDDLDMVFTLSCARNLSAAGIEAVPVSIFDIEVRAGNAFIGNDRIHVLWACISFEAEATIPELWAKSRELLALVADGTLVYLVPPGASVLGNKALLALITSERDDDLFTAVERDLIDRAIPWTALVTHEAIDALCQRRAELVLKPARGVGGLGILYGVATSPQAWRLALMKITASNKPFVAQQLCPPHVMDMPAGVFGEEAMAVDLVLGGICIDGRFAGNLVRWQRAGGYKPINVSRGGHYSAACTIHHASSPGWE